MKSLTRTKKREYKILTRSLRNHALIDAKFVVAILDTNKAKCHSPRASFYAKSTPVLRCVQLKLNDFNGILKFRSI